MLLTSIQQEAIQYAKNHRGRLVRWGGGIWTFEGARLTGDKAGGHQLPEWYCRTNTIFALVRRGYMVMINSRCCFLIKLPEWMKDSVILYENNPC